MTLLWGQSWPAGPCAHTHEIWQWCEAFERFQNPVAIDAEMMFVISIIGLLVNLVLMKVASWVIL